MAIPFKMINLDKPRRLRFGMGAMIEFEQLTGVKLVAIDDDDIPSIFKALWVMLRQDDEDLTLEDVCKLVDENTDNVIDTINTTKRAIELALNGEKKSKAKGEENPNAQKPKK